MQKSSERGHEFFVAVEPEFFLFPKGEIPATRSEVASNAGYFALVPADVEETVRKAIVSWLSSLLPRVLPPNADLRPCSCQSRLQDSLLAGCTSTSPCSKKERTHSTIRKMRWDCQCTPGYLSVD
ncbi:hypothetical protein KAX17_07700 [Candidatus Bipolaricaulota bacterium]|nr:hypothetical protein [Candidatus Bipolaricaulota bacterium]